VNGSTAEDPVNEEPARIIQTDVELLGTIPVLSFTDLLNLVLNDSGVFAISSFVKV
jgi:hypothetical protein